MLNESNGVVLDCREYPSEDQYSLLELILDVSTMSKAEYLPAAMKYYGKGKIVGRNTSGVPGPVAYVTLPSGEVFRFTIVDITYHDGSVFTSEGLVPDVVVGKTLENLVEGKDIFVELAIEELKK